ncbi:hypothetical protein QWZ16_00980 [Vibrio ostreicida]|uniref:Uncharacterized protein n=1 Tax=Vibrio ostreicida TaxID=526588 RepID=A0ABT8BPJ4_9VIBR|nr:hypothetical protein [Vibrio ostreicida]MDN3608361.1 hypothetical protein [Vibrio ostreicida]
MIRHRACSSRFSSDTQYLIRPIGRRSLPNAVKHKQSNYKESSLMGGRFYVSTFIHQSVVGVSARMAG